MDEQNKFETEIDFKALPKSPSRLFGWIFPYYLVLFVIVGIYFVKHMDDSSFNAVPAIYTDSLVINANVEVKQGGIMPAVDLGIISNPPSSLIEKGKTLYATNCSSCHGNEGKGDGIAAAALTPPPRNLHVTDGWTNGRDFEALYKTLEKGVPGTGMIAYEYIPVEDRIAILQYIRTFVEYPVVTDEAITQLDETYELSKGVITPSNISIEMASRKINEEAALDSSVVELAIEKLSLEDKNLVELFNNVVEDKEKVIAIYKRDFANNANANDFINRVINFPTESGFKSNAALLSKDKLNDLFKLLSKTVG